MKKILLNVSELQKTAKGKKLVAEETARLKKVRTPGAARQYAHNAAHMKNGARKDVIMMLTMTAKLILGKLSMPRRDKDFLLKSQTMYAAIIADTGGFYTPVFSMLARWDTQNDDYAQAIKNVKLGVYGAEAAKQAAKAALLITLDFALAYINGLARLDQRNAAEIITGAKMELVKETSFSKQDFAVKQGKATGEIALSSKAARINNKYVAVIYEWKFSIDDGKNWESLSPTNKAKTIADGMLVGIRTLFSRRYKTKDGYSDWCDAIGIIPL